MKRHTGYLKLMLVAAISIQVGCSGNNANRRSNLYPAYSTVPAGGHTTAGDAFASSSNGMIPGGGDPYSWKPAIDNFFGTSDTDQDGVIDASDKCPNSGVAGQVDAYGCPVSATTDTNGDGVVDSKDTKKGETKAVLPEEFDVNFDEELRVKEKCDTMKAARKDDDGDTIYNYCEENIDLVGLDPTVYNGYMVAARMFTLEKKGKANIGEGTSLQLTKDEKKAYKDSTYYKDVGLDPEEGDNDKLDKLVAVKYFARVVAHQKDQDVSGADQKAIKDVFEIEQKNGGTGTIPIKLNKRAKAVLGRNNTDAESLPENLGVVTGVGLDAVPFSTKGAKSVSELAAIEPQTSNIPKDSGFMFIAETHVVVPAGGLNIAVGNLLNQSNTASGGSKAGLFFAFVNNGSELVSSDMMLDKEEGHPLKRLNGKLEALSGCMTAHLVIAFFSDKKEIPGANLFSENVFYSEPGENIWRPFSQDMLRLQPLNLNEDETCTFDPEHVFFTKAKSILGTSMDDPTVGQGKKDTLNDLQNSVGALEKMDAKDPKFADEKKKVLDALQVEIDSDLYNKNEMATLDALKVRAEAAGAAVPPKTGGGMTEQEKQDYMKKLDEAVTNLDANTDPDFDNSKATVIKYIDLAIISGEYDMTQIQTLQDLKVRANSIVKP